MQEINCKAKCYIAIRELKILKAYYENIIKVGVNWAITEWALHDAEHRLPAIEKELKELEEKE